MRGSKPGEHRGGRAKGTKNRATIERELAAAADLKRHRERGVMPLDVLLDIMRYYRGKAAQVQPGTPQHDENQFNEYMKLAGMFARDAAPYIHPRLSSVTLKEQPWDLTRLSDAELVHLEQIQHKAALPGGNSEGEAATQH